MGTSFLKQVSVHSLRLLARGPLWVAAKETARLSCRVLDSSKDHRSTKLQKGPLPYQSKEWEVIIQPREAVTELAPSK